MSEEDKSLMTDYNILKARSACRESPSNCDECPFKDHNVCCISVMSVTTDEMIAAYEKKYNHKLGEGRPKA